MFNISYGQDPITNIISSLNGYIGISSKNPKATLHIKDYTGHGPTGILYERNYLQLQISSTVGGETGWIGTKTNHPLILGTNNNTNSLYLDTNSNVYVGGVNDNFVSDALRSKNDLFVKNGILAEDLTVGAKEFWADYVFNKEYKLRSLSELEQFIKKNKHLPNIPSKKVISKEGYSMHDLNVRFLEKVEELTLYIIKQEKQIKKLEKRLDGLSRSEK